MSNEDFKLILVFSFTCAMWWTAGFLAGYTGGAEVACEEAFDAGVEVGLAKASTPSDS